MEICLVTLCFMVAVQANFQQPELSQKSFFAETTRVTVTDSLTVQINTSLLSSSTSPQETEEWELMGQDHAKLLIKLMVQIKIK